MQTALIADILLSVTLSSQVQGRIAKNPEQEVKQCRSSARPPFRCTDVHAKFCNLMFL